jgi:hypothetical protein
MPHDLVDAAGDAGVPLLPGIGDLDPSCTCDSWELPCQHAAGLCYQVAWLLDEDPFVLLLMRGQSREDLLDELQQRVESVVGVPESAGPAPQPGVGVPAVEVFAAEVGVLPEPPDVPAKVGLDDLVVSGTQPLGELVLLPLLVLDAARRARAQLSALLSGGAEPWVLDEWQDAVRLAADYPELGDSLREATGRPAELAIGVQAWSYGGAPALDVLENSWSPEAGELARARVEVQAAADDPIELMAEGNRLTAGGRQLRLDRVGRWHPYRLDSDQWMPAGPPDRDPAAAFAVQDEW